jgi:hypothetical protein
MRDSLESVLNLARSLPREELPRLLGDLAEISATANARLASHTVEARPDELLDIAQASARLRMSKDYLYRHWQRLPFARREGKKSLRFSSNGIDAYLRRAVR